MRIIKGKNWLAALVFSLLTIWCGNSIALSGVASLNSLVTPFFGLVFISILIGFAYEYLATRKSKARRDWLAFTIASLLSFVLIPVVFFGLLALLSYL